MFIGRTEERKLLKRELNASDSRILLLYGRRRVGKSELIQHVLHTDVKEVSSLYYECKRTTEQSNISAIAELLSEADRIPMPFFHDMEELLRYFYESATDKNRILVLDEYSYLRDAVKGLDSILQVTADQFQKKSHLKIILCGSYIDTMRSLLDADNPLYGRISYSIKLNPMNYRESAQFYPEYAPEDRIMLHSVFGGIPYYNRWIDPQISAIDNIKALILSNGARLENEVPAYLRTELAKLENANEAFEAMAKGYSRYSDILSQSHISSSPNLANVLDKLVLMEVVEKRAPINDEHNKRKTGYYISDPLSRFYYKYIFRYLSQRAIMPEDVFFERYVCKDFETQYIPHHFEQICKEFLIEKNRSGSFSPPFEKIGSYYYDDPTTKTNGEFDVVTQDEKGFIFYEVKYRKQELTKAMIERELQQANQSGLHPYHYGFFLRAGVQEDALSENMTVYTLEELYA